MRVGSLQAQILILLVVPLFLAIPAALYVTHTTMDGEFTMEIDRRGVVLAKQAGDMVVDDLLTGEFPAATRKLTDMQRTDPAIAYMFSVNRHGRVTSHTFSGGFPIDLLKVHEVDSPRVARTVRIGDETVRDVSAGMLGNAAGVVHVGMSNRQARATSQRIFARLALLGGVIITLGVGLATWTSRRFTARIGRVASAAEHVARGNLDVQIPVRGDDEIARLSSRFNDMVQELRRARWEQEQTFIKLGQSEKLMAIGRLAAGVAHELNNPLSGLRHCIDNLRQSASPERQERYYALMEDGVLRAQNIVGSLLDYARPKAPARRLQAVGPMIDRAAELVRSGSGRGARIIVDVPEEALQIEVDPHQIQQVLINLITNGLEAMKKGGTVRLSADLDEGRCRIDVSDDGSGIPPEALARVFDPFFTTKGKTGSGLGLSVSRGIVERHDGELRIVSKRSGTTVSVFLPLSAPSDQDGRTDPQ